MTNKLIGLILIIACAGCCYWGYSTYMEETEAARAIDDIAKSSGINKIIGDDATKPAIPNNTKFALAGAAITGVAGLVLVVKS